MGKVIVYNPETGAPINGFHIKEEGFHGDVFLKTGASIELPEVAAKILLETYLFLEKKEAIEVKEAVGEVRDPDAEEETAEAEVIEYTEESTAELHSDSKDVEISLECGICNRAFTTKAGLASHIRAAH